MSKPTSVATPGPKEALTPHSATGPGKGQTHTSLPAADWSSLLQQEGVLNRITRELDLESLFNLGRTCRPLNDLIFVAYIDGKRPRDGFYGLDRNIGYLSAPTAHPEGLLTALRCSLALHTSIQSIGYGFLPARGFQGLIEDLTDLYTIFQRQPRSMAHVCLYLSQLDFAIKSSDRAFQGGFRPTAESFRDKLCGVMDCAIQKGAILLDVNGGLETMQHLTRVPHSSEPGPSMETSGFYHGPKSIRAASRASFSSTPEPSGGKLASPSNRTFKMRKFFSSLKGHLRPSNVDRDSLDTEPVDRSFDSTPAQEAGISPTEVLGRRSSVESTVAPLAQLSLQAPSSFTKSPSLQDVRIRTDMLLSPLFLPWTLKLLNSNAETLTTLKFECSLTPSSTWHTIFNAIDLSKLLKVELTVAPLLVEHQLVINPDDLALFLSRCESIQEVVLYGVRPGRPSSKVLNDLRFPNLTSFAGHPSHVSWIFRLGPSAVPRLRWVTLTTEYYNSPISLAPFDHAILSDALDVINRDGRRLGLGFCFKSQDGLEAWMKDRTERGASCAVDNIHALQITFSWYMGFNNKKLETVCKFINSFRGVESVAFDELLVLPDPSKIGKGDSAATKKFFSKHLSPHVKRVKINNNGEVKLESRSWSTSGLSSSARLPGPPDP